METFFAPAERTGNDQLASEIQSISNNVIMSGMLSLANGLLTILDTNRQIVAVNDSFMQTLETNPLGLRLGEAIQCIHADEKPAGCGTTKFCSSCGAAIAMVASLRQNKPSEKICAVTIKHDGKTNDLALMVKAQPITINHQVFLLLFLQDITRQQQRAALERTFFHDVNNMLYGLVGASELLSLTHEQSDLVAIIRRSSLRLKNEIDIQKCILQSETGLYEPLWQVYTSKDVINELKSFFINHPKAKNRHLYFRELPPQKPFTTDMSLLLRVLCNMVTNALEATGETGEVKIWSETGNTATSFCVWNQEMIPSDIALRIFQLHFSTKNGSGRGVGTYSMKLFGEKILGGRVNFTTSKENGTLFKIALPFQGLTTK